MSYSTSKFVTKSEQQTFELGKRLGQLVMPGMVVGLSGTLGAGKTKFTQGFVNGVVGKDIQVVSPTYTLCVPYSGRVDLIHMDAYRLKEEEEFFELGLDEELDLGKVLIIEWVDKIEELIHQLDLKLLFEVAGERHREVVVLAQSERGQELMDKLV